MKRANKSKSKNEVVIDPDIDYSKRKSVHSVNSLLFIAGLIYVIVIANISSQIFQYVPELKDSNIPFVGREAWSDLRILNDMGPKVTGSKENEDLALNFLKKRIVNIQSRASERQNVNFDHQVASGNYFLQFKPYGMVTSYRKIQNLVVRLEGETPNALMMNCHFDTVPGSPGAGDDGANCAIMLELLSILSTKETKNRHTIIFVFNGAEETGLRASHGFITQHKWANDIRAFINLEAGGSGGKEILFQSGPGNSWLLNHYQAVSRPYAQVASEEIFQSGIIPSDTDFRVFRDFGNLAGLDFAHATKGYRYHTKFDSINYLTPGVLQRTGENMLHLVLSLANSNELGNITESLKNSSAVYFDFIGFFFVTYSKEAGVAINFLVVILSIVIPFLTLTKTTVNSHAKNILSETLLGFVSIVFGSGFSGLLCYITAYVLDQMDHSMSWYRNTFLAPGIYSIIALFAHVVVQDLFVATFANKKSPISLGLKIQARMNGVNVFWGIITLGVTVLGIRSGYLVMIILLINLISSTSIYLFGLHNSVHKWVLIHLYGQFFAIIWSTYLHNMILDLFIPITGRSGSNRNPDALISIICCATTLFICSYMMPLAQLLKSKVTKYLTLITIFLISIFLATSTSVGFPYQNDSTGNPAIQRHYIVNTVRNFFDERGELRYSDAGYYFIQWDRHSKKTIEGIAIPDEPVHFSEICNDELFCGLPLVSSRSLLVGGQWLPGSTPKLSDIAVIDLHEKENLDESKTKLIFTVNGTSLSSIFIRPRGNADLISWSFLNDIPETFNKTYFISIANGIDTEPFHFDLTLRSEDKSQNAIVDITLVSMKFGGQNDYTNEFKNLLKRVPNWAFAQNCIAAVTSYVF